MDLYIPDRTSKTLSHVGMSIENNLVSVFGCDSGDFEQELAFTFTLDRPDVVIHRHWLRDDIFGYINHLAKIHGVVKTYRDEYDKYVDTIEVKLSERDTVNILVFQNTICYNFNKNPNNSIVTNTKPFDHEIFNAFFSGLSLEGYMDVNPKMDTSIVLKWLLTPRGDIAVSMGNQDMGEYSPICDHMAIRKYSLTSEEILLHKMNFKSADMSISNYMPVDIETDTIKSLKTANIGDFEFFYSDHIEVVIGFDDSDLVYSEINNKINSLYVDEDEYPVHQKPKDTFRRKLHEIAFRAISGDTNLFHMHALIDLYDSIVSFENHYKLYLQQTNLSSEFME